VATQKLLCLERMDHASITAGSVPTTSEGMSVKAYSKANQSMVQAVGSPVIGTFSDSFLARKTFKLRKPA